MAINVDIWGSPETWDAYGTTKVPNFAGAGSYKNSILGGIDTGVFEWNGTPIDTTCAPWGINKDSSMCNSNWLYVGASVGGTWDTLDNVTIYTREIYENTGDMSYLPTLRSLGTGDRSKNSVPFAYQYTPNAGAYNSYKAYNNTIPILAFPYNNIVVVPWVMCCKSNPDAASGYDLYYCSVKDYFDTYKSTYPWICSLFIKGYFTGNRPDVIIQRTADASDYSNSRATVNRWDNRVIKQQICSWNGHFSQYRANMRYAGGFTYEVIAGREISNSNPIEFYLSRNEAYPNDDIAFARWSYSGEPPVIRGNMFEFDYKFTEPRLYVTPKWDATLADVMRELAFYGYWFTLDESKARTAYTGQYCVDDDMCIPVFDENGITTGEYKTGLEAAAIAPADDATPADFIDYDPYKPPVPPENEDSGDLFNAGNYLHKFGAEGLTIWAFYRTSLGGNGLDAAINAITNLYLTDPDGNEKWQLDFKGSNPDDYIVSLMAFPLDFTLSESTYTFKLGPVDFEGVDVKKYADTGFFTFGSLTVPAYGDFRDYAPYTTAELYIPFCGTCDIDMAFFAGRDLIVDMYYDIYTGSCAAAIYRYTSLGKTLYKTINGQIGVEIPLSAARMGDYQSTLHALETAQKQNDIRIATSVLGMGITAGATIATGGATLPLLAAGVASTMGVVSSVQKSDELNYQIEHTQPKPTQTTAASTQNNYCVGGTRCMLFIKRAHMDSGYNADVYGRTKGFACLLNNTVNDNSGLTVCSNIDTSDIPATADEINAIKQAFASGVII